RSHWNSALGLLPGKILFLGGCGHGHSTAVVQWLVHFSAHPQVMQQHRQLLAVATIARLLPLLPPRSASFKPQRRRSQSTPNGPKICCAPCTITSLKRDRLPC